MSPYLYIKKALLIVAMVVVSWFFVRSFLVPASFGQYGQYRGDHLLEERSRNPVHTGSQVCGECHEDNLELISAGRHTSVPCEVCHFQPYAGDEERPNVHPEVSNAPDRSRAACAICHEYLPSRPNKFPQLKNINSHISQNWKKMAGKNLGDLNAGAPCITCHNPHSPKLIVEKE